MLISLNWLQQYLPTIDQIDARMIADKLSNSLAEVEEITKIGEGVNKIVTGEILSTEAHPKTETLQVCQVKINTNETLQVIHGGGLKVKKGDKCPVCLIGGTVYDPSQEFRSNKVLEVEEVEIKGIKSQGMLCSIKELGLYDEHKAVMLLDPNSRIGEDLTPYLKDTVLEIENKSLTHRPDAFSHLGIARELAAILKLELKSNTELQEVNIQTEELPLKIDYNVKNSICPRFTALNIQNISVQPSPFWMQARLAITGMRPINNIIDVSNYVMFDLGQPSHAFDYDKLNGKKIIIRNAKHKEKIEALDEKTYELKNDHVILADNSGPIGIPGIIGGENTAIDEKTQNVTLVIENWDMFTIRRISRDLGIRTEASTRFEKGLDESRLIEMQKITTNTIIDIAGGEIASDIFDIYPNPKAPKEIIFDLNSVLKILGIELSKEEIINILEGLSIEISGDEKIEENTLTQVDQSNQILLHIPSYRKDLNIKEDIVEEIARIYGYDKMPNTLPLKEISPVKTNTQRKLIKKLKLLLTGYGLNELYTYSMLGEKLIQASNLEVGDFLAIKNPLNPELKYLRHSILPTLVEKIELNSKNHIDNFGVFELSRIIHKTELNEEKIPSQPHRVAIAMYSSTNKTFRPLKGILDQLENDLKIEFETVNLNSNQIFKLEGMFHPSQSAILKIGQKEIGVFGNIHPIVLQNYDLKGHVSILELEIEGLFGNPNLFSINYNQISDYPATYRDLSFYINKKHEAGSILKKIKTSGIKNLESIEISDIYVDENLKNTKSITLSIMLQSQTKTLEDSEIQEAIQKIQKILQGKFKATIRE